MSRKKKEIFVLRETKENKKEKNTGVSEAVLCFLVLSGILLFLRDFSYSTVCLAAAFVTGAALILLYRITERSEKDFSRIKTILYIVEVVGFLGTITLSVQGFFYVVDCFLGMWNARFGTEAELFAVGSNAAVGSVILWILFAATAVSIIFSQIKKNNIYGILLLLIPSAAAGLILGQSDMWFAVFLSLAGFFGIFIVYSTQGGEFGIRGAVTILGIGVLVGVIALTSGGYEKFNGLEQWKESVAENFQKFRYGEDTLPKGNLAQADSLFEDGEKERLKITVNQPQELYLRGFVGGEYDGTRWKELSYDAYQGEYEGMLRWLNENDFSPLSQYSAYEKLNDEATGQTTGYSRVTVENTGAYRKYVYLPAVAEAWEKGRENKDWNMESTSFFGARRYQFQVPENTATADNQNPGSWLSAPSGEAEAKYVQAESVYHSFVLDSYTGISDELKQKIQEKFFPEGTDTEEMSFDELTTQIRKVLRNNIHYTEYPEAIPADTDAVSWLLDGEKDGNAVAFATMAVMAYRAAGYPARYTEGYHLSSMDAQAAADAGKKDLTLTTQNAHAWAEVYISGLGWMPVEVVPGLYVETYTDQLVQGKPSYRVNDTRNESGMDTTDTGTGGDAGKAENSARHETKPLLLAGGLVLFLYAVFILYLLLELQRALRIKKRSAAEKQKKKEGHLVEWYVAQIEKLFRLGGVKGEFTDPKALWEEVERCFPGIREEEYLRVCELTQKYRFGGLELEKREFRVLHKFKDRLKQSLYAKSRGLGKLKLRYIDTL